MKRGVFLAALAALAAAAPIASNAQNPLQQGLGPETAAPPPPARPAAVLPGYTWDAATGRYVAEDGHAVWVPGHWDERDGRRAWIGGQWLMRSPAGGYGR